MKKLFVQFYISVCSVSRHTVISTTKHWQQRGSISKQIHPMTSHGIFSHLAKGLTSFHFFSFVEKWRTQQNRRRRIKLLGNSVQLAQRKFQYLLLVYFVYFLHVEKRMEYIFYITNTFLVWRKISSTYCILRQGSIWMNALYSVNRNGERRARLKSCDASRGAHYEQRRPSEISPHIWWK